MKDSIKQVYLGLPIHLIEIVFWVGRDFRKNSLSHQEGGSDVVVEYHNGKVLGYGWIKFPSKYIFKIFVRNISKSLHKFLQFEEQRQLEIAKQEITRVFARKRYQGNDNIQPFVDIWTHSTSTELPWSQLEVYDTYNSETDFHDEIKQADNKLSWQYLIENKEAVLSIFATHFSFCSAQLVKFMHLFPYGRAFEYSNGHEL